jgi:Co/Zn/Cd efflux system component
MDCPTEESMIRMALSEVEPLGTLEFDLPGRVLVVLHGAPAAEVLARLSPLGLGARIASSEPVDDDLLPVAPAPGSAEEARTLGVLLAINFVMFAAEVAAGWIAQSTGLIADGLDMLTDAVVYGLSLYAVGRPARLQIRAAHVSGWFQMLLAASMMAEVIRRFVVGSEPEPGWMMGVSVVALAANVACLVLISRHRHGGAHMKASWIFSTNDVLANLGVIAAGVLVAGTGSRLPDLAIGALIAAVVLAGAVRILRLR